MSIGAPTELQCEKRSGSIHSTRVILSIQRTLFEAYGAGKVEVKKLRHGNSSSLS